MWGRYRGKRIWNCFQRGYSKLSCCLFFFFLRKIQRPATVSGILASFSEKVHEFLAPNKLSSLQLPTRKLNFQVLHRSLVITNMIIGAVTVGAGRGWRMDLTAMRKYSSSGLPAQTYRHTQIYTHTHRQPPPHTQGDTLPQGHTSTTMHISSQKRHFLRGSYYPGWFFFFKLNLTSIFGMFI